MLTDFERLYSQNVFKVNLSLCRERAEAPDISWVNIQVVALRHNRQGEIVVVAAFVIDLEGVAACSER